MENQKEFLRHQKLKKGRKKSFFRFLSLERFNISKRKRFVIAVFFLSFGLFASDLMGKSGFFASFILAVLTDVLLFWTNHRDIKENFSHPTFILPFFYSLSFGLFCFLVPGRFLARIVVTVLYAVGLYSLFLSQNIFTVASIRTIALLSSARTVSFILTLVPFFFLTNVIFTFDLQIIPTVILVLISAIFLMIHSFWTYTLDKSLFSELKWVLALSLCIAEISLILWFWPTTPTIIALFLTGFFYTIVGLSHVWYEKRLFKGVMWEYLWVGVIVTFVLFLSTSWKGT